MTSAKGPWTREPHSLVRAPDLHWPTLDRGVSRERHGVHAWARLRGVLAGVCVVFAAVLWGGYGAAGAIVYGQITHVDALCGGRFADHDPGHWDTDGISSEFTVSLDPGPYLIPDFEEVTFPSRDPRKYALKAWWAPAANASAPVVLLVHGQSSCRRDPVLLLPAGMLHRNGFSVLLVDLRDHGDSEVEDARYSNGTEEYLDVLGAWDWLVASGISPARIGVLGESLGAAVAIIAVGQEPRIAALWEGSSYANYRAIATEELSRLGYPHFLLDAAVRMGRLISGDDVTAHDPDGEIARLAGRPLFIVHGAADVRINPHHAFDLASAATAGGTPVEPWIVPGAHHSEAAFIDPDAYEMRLVGFFRDALTER